MSQPQTVEERQVCAEDDIRVEARWRDTLEIAGVRDGDTVLDVGSGTGSLAAAIAAAAPTSRVTGIDPTEAYVAFARARHPWELLYFEVGDAQQLRFANGSFDRTLTLLALNFVPAPAKALAEMSRVTRRGGTVAAAVWDYGAGMEMLRVFRDEVVALDPEMAARDERHMPLCRSGALGALWRGHGLHDVSERALTIRTRFRHFDDYWSPFLAGQGPAGACVARFEPDSREELRQRLRRRLAGRGPDRPITLTARAWAVQGIVPSAAKGPVPVRSFTRGPDRLARPKHRSCRTTTTTVTIPTRILRL